MKTGTHIFDPQHAVVLSLLQTIVTHSFLMAMLLLLSVPCYTTISAENPMHPEYLAYSQVEETLGALKRSAYIADPHMECHGYATGKDSLSTGELSDLFFHLGK